MNSKQEIKSYIERRIRADGVDTDCDDEPERLGVKLSKLKLKNLTAKELLELQRSRDEQEAHKRTSRIGLSLSMLRNDCGARLGEATLDNFERHDPVEMEASLGRIVSYAEDIERRIGNGDGLFLIGPPGTGKDHLAVAVARIAVVELAVSARWLDAATLRLKLRECFGTKSSERAILKPYVTTKILVLSDPVAPGSNLSDFQADTLFRLIDGRYRERRPTFITGNFRDEAEASELLGSQLVDRLSHGSLRLRCSWESYRKGE